MASGAKPPAAPGGSPGANRLNAIFIRDIRSDLADDKLIWPSVPVVVMKVRKVLADSEASVDAITRAVSTDPALSVKLLKVANSVYYASAAPCKTLRSAVVRLGHRAIEHATLLLVVSQVFSVGKRRRIQPLLARLWRHSTLVAAICEQLALESPMLEADVAMLAGLVHDIGTIPVLVRAEQVPELLTNERFLVPLVRALHTEIGSAMLSAWRFPSELSSVVGEHENIERQHALEPDYADVVIAANVLSRLGSKHPYGEICLETVPAVQKFRMSTEDLLDIVNRARQREAALREL